MSYIPFDNNDMTEEEALNNMTASERQNYYNDKMSLGGAQADMPSPGVDMPSSSAMPSHDPVAPIAQMISAPKKSPLTEVQPLDKNPEPSPISPDTLARLSQSRPDLVDAYRQKMAGANANLADAQKNQRTGDLINVAGKFANDWGNSNKRDVILKHNLAHMGEDPTIMKANRPEYDGQALNDLTARGVDTAKAAKAAVFSGMQQDQQVDLMNKQQQAADPNSDISKRAQMLAKSAINARVREARMANDPEGAATLNSTDVSGMSATDAKQLFDDFKNAPDYKAVLTAQTANQVEASKSKDRQLTTQARQDQLNAAAAAKSEKNYTDMTNHIVSFRGNEPAQHAGEAVRLAGNAQDIVKNYPDLNSIPDDQVKRLNEELGKIATGGVATQHSAQGADTYNARWQAFKAKVGNEPKPAELGAFIQQNLNYLNNLKESNQAIVNKFKTDVYHGYRGSLQPEQIDRFKLENPDLFTDAGSKAPSNTPPISVGGPTVVMTTPDGKQYNVPADKVDAVKAKGWK